MDNTLVNIDDLVRQRLSGNEEREPSGAWLRMSELLDKEMPRRPAAFMWRRMFGVVAGLLLIASITVGGYELSAFKNLNGNNNIAAITPAANERSANTTTKNNNPGNEVTDNKQLLASGIANNNPAKNDTKDNSKKAIAANENHKVNKQHRHSTVAASAVAPAKKEGNNKEAGNFTKATDENPSTDIAATDGVAKETKQVTTTKTVTAPANNTVTIANKPVKKHVAKTVSAPAANNTVAIAGKSVKKHVAKTASPAPVGTTTGNPATGGIAKGTNNAAVAANSLATSTKPHNAGTKAAKAKPVSMGALPLSSSTTGTNNNATPATMLTSINKVAGKGNSNTTNVAPGNALNNVAANNSATPIVLATASNAGAGNTATAIPVVNKNVLKKNKTTIERMVVLKQLYLKATPNTSIYHLDTISDNLITSITQENANENNVTPLEPNTNMLNNSSTTINSSSATTAASNTPSHNTARTSGATGTGVTNSAPVAAGATANNSGTAPVNNPSPANNPGNLSGSVASNQTPNSQILPGASSSASEEKSALGKKESSADKQSKGAEELAKLLSTFNDIKYKVGAVQFAPGLIAGINGTFFGPNSFKGFQFGLSGTFVFSDAISILTELKYFQRINNDYELNDNYYNYIGNGPYLKELVQNSYSFSTLHSFEMPLIIKYSKGNFSFFGGANLVYSFSINVGADSMSVPNSQTTVAAKGNDNAPKLAVADFGARFGIGYLFGVSYRVSPNFTLDLRDVQTAWDNANTSGAKDVSTQLYKSPSFQFSVGYRLGGNKHKE